MSFRTRLSLVLGGVVLILVTTTSLVIYQSVRLNLDRQVDRFLVNRVASVATRLESTPLPRGQRFRNPLGQALLDVRFDVESQVIDADGAVVFAIGELAIPVTSEDIAIAAGDAAEFRDVILANRKFRLYVVPVQGGGAVQIARDIEENVALLQRTRNWLLGLGTALVVFSTLISWLLARVITKPLRTLSTVANQIASTGSLEVSVPVAGASEVRSLASSVNTMLERIRESMTRERQFIQDASHELRTPLTSLRANSELLERPELTPAERSDILLDIRTEVDELTTISSELSTLATDQRHTESIVDVNLFDATEVVVERMRRRTKRTINCTLIEGATPTTGVIRIRLAQFERALSNLLDNALKFSPSTSTVDVEVESSEVRIIDHGPGIPDSDKTKVFTRFFRSDATRSYPGSGLGLAIVQQFALDHEGSVDVTDTPGGGATIHLRL